MSTGDVNQPAELPDDFWDHEDKLQAAFERIVQANKLGGHSDGYADLDTTDDVDDEDEDTDDDADDAGSEEDGKRRDIPS